jgi:hypothetical protein
MSIPAYLPYFVLNGTIAMLVAILYGINRALADANWPTPNLRRALLISTSVLIGWLAVSIMLGAMGVYHVDRSAIPTIQYGILLPILIGVVLIWRSEPVKRLIEAIPQQWLVSVQLYRALGVIFLILYATGKLPGLFAWPAGVGDIAIGLLAPVVGYAYARAPRRAASLVAGWNVFGILDLIVAVGTGFLTAPSLIQPLEVQPTSDLMTVLPMVLIPVYLVPLSIILHLASLAKLRWSAEAATRKGNMTTARA